MGKKPSHPPKMAVLCPNLVLIFFRKFTSRTKFDMFFFSEWTKSPGKSSAWAHGRSVKHGISLGCVYKQPPKNASKKNIKKTDRLFWARDLAETARCFKITSRKRCPPKEKKRFAAILCLWPLVWDGQKLLVTKVTSKKNTRLASKTPNGFGGIPQKHTHGPSSRQLFGRLSLPVTNRPSPEK